MDDSGRTQTHDCITPPASEGTQSKVLPNPEIIDAMPCGKYVDVNPSSNEGGYSPMTAAILSARSEAYKPRAIRAHGGMASEDVFSAANANRRSHTWMLAAIE